jgi:hypothetical protein
MGNVVISVNLPVFAFIAIGMLAARLKVLGPDTIVSVHEKVNDER